MNDQPDLFDTPVSAVAAPSAAPPIQRFTIEPVLVLAFPLDARVGKIRDVARKLSATKTERHGESYRAQVTEALRVHLRSKHVPADQHHGEIASFWRAVNIELARQQHGRQQA